MPSSYRQAYSSKPRSVRNTSDILEELFAPYESVDLGGLDVIQLFHGILDLTFVRPEIHDEDQSVVLLNLLHCRFGVQWPDNSGSAPNKENNYNETTATDTKTARSKATLNSSLGAALYTAAMYLPKKLLPNPFISWLSEMKIKKRTIKTHETIVLN
jgi:hypothetical protein